MPKMKTHRGTAKRIRATGSGKLRRRRQNARHILTKKSMSRKRRLRSETDVHESDVRRVRALLPYI